jgi:hypothetical protein
MTPWGDNSRVCAGLDEADIVDLERRKTEARIEATETLDRLTAGLFGYHTDRIMPQIFCRQTAKTSCVCCKYSTLHVPFFPLVSINKIVIECVEQDLTNFRIDNGNTTEPYIVRLDDYWPVTQCYTDYCDPDNPDPESSGDGWWIEYVYGRPVPMRAHSATNLLASEYLYRDCAPEKCNLPTGTSQVSRQGVTITISDASTFFDQGLTGIAMVDSFIREVNPTGTRTPASFSNIDLRGKCRFIRPDTGLATVTI